MLIRYKNAIFGTCNTTPYRAEKPTCRRCPRVFSQFGFLSAALCLDQMKRNEILRFKSVCCGLLLEEALRDETVFTTMNITRKY